MKGLFPTACGRTAKDETKWAQMGVEMQAYQYVGKHVKLAKSTFP